MWLSEEKLSKSYYNYGVPKEILRLLDLNVGEEITYTDLIVYYSRKFDIVNYLELGVSVGKNFTQVASSFKNSFLTGFDIENINTPLLEKFKYLSDEVWDTMPNSKRLEKSTLTHFKFNTNNIDYLAGDIWDENSWKKLCKKKFNIIFSDALHEPKALLWEYEMIKKYSLLADKFIYIWDDLNNGLENSFEDIADDLKKSKNLNRENIYLIKINGWLGKNYPFKHDVGIISNIKLD